MPLWKDDTEVLHWPACRTNCTSPRIGQTDECEAGHDGHYCSCDDAAAAHFEQLAEAAAEQRSELRQQ